MRKQLSVAAILQSAGAISVSDGERLEFQVRETLANGDGVDVSLGGLDMATTAFINALVIPLYETFDADEVDARVAFVDTEESDRVRISRARERGIERRANPHRDSAYGTQVASL